MTDSLNATRQILLAAIIQIRNFGPVAPLSVTISPYAVTKKLKDNTIRQFDYYKLECENPIFDGKKGKTRYLHLAPRREAPRSSEGERRDESRACWVGFNAPEASNNLYYSSGASWFSMYFRSTDIVTPPHDAMKYDSFQSTFFQ